MDYKDVERRHPHFFPPYVTAAGLPDAWLPLLDEMCRKISERLGPDEEGLAFSDVKEKLGSLIVSYEIDGGLAAHRQFLFALKCGIAKMSMQTCVECGASSATLTPLGKGWVHPLCAKHYAVWKESQALDR